MMENLEERLQTVLSDLAPEDVHAVAAFANFLTEQRRARSANRDLQLAERTHADMIAALDEVAGMTMEQGPPVSNRDHDRYLYGGE
jgi:hypothetical protein